MDRASILSSLSTNQNVDVLVIGGGINGAGVFRDLALNGVDVLLIDRGDFCSGASSTSSHMAHGGIRYLENGEFRLVEEAVTERNRMIENAPHLVKPLPTVIPIFKIWSGLLNAPLKFLNLLDRPSERGALVIKIGLFFYDSFTRKQKTVPRHQFYRRDKVFQLFPQLNEKTKYAAVYYDGQLLAPERMTVEIILDGEDEGSHARALNYMSFRKMERDTVFLEDIETGSSYIVKPKIIINAAGPWVDFVNLGAGVNEKYIGGTKGSHLIIRNPELKKAIGESEFFFENKDGRIVLLLPFYDKVIVGTSDLPIDNPDDARCTIEEEDYFIKLILRVFPTIKVTNDQIVFRFSGVRPLEYMKAKTTGQISRDHSLKENIVNGIPIFSLVGGKWTSFRAFSEQVTDTVLKALRKERKNSTATLPIRGGKNFPTTEIEKIDFIKKIGDIVKISDTYSNILFTRYGTKGLEIARFIQDHAGTQLKTIENWNTEEVSFIIKTEKPVHLEDIFLRRSPIAWMGDLSIELITELAGIMGKDHKWDDKKKRIEVQRTLQVISDFHGVNLQ
jgi:glycerol-3-phosphate dehydrogenase